MISNKQPVAREIARAESFVIGLIEIFFFNWLTTSERHNTSLMTLSLIKTAASLSAGKVANNLLLLTFNALG